MAVLGLRFCTRAFSSCGKWGPLFIAVRGPLTIAASLVAEHRFQTRRLSSCGSRAQLLRGIWDPLRPGLEPVSPALAGRFSTTAPPGEPFSMFNWDVQGGRTRTGEHGKLKVEKGWDSKEEKVANHFKQDWALAIRFSNMELIDYLYRCGFGGINWGWDWSGFGKEWEERNWSYW